MSIATKMGLAGAVRRIALRASTRHGSGTYGEQPWVTAMLMPADRLELKVPPLALALIFAGAMFLVSMGMPSLAFATLQQSALALVLVGAGVAFCLAGVVAFRKARTTVNPTRPEGASMMVTTGIYRVSRNPMYVGFLLILAGWAVFLGHLLSFLLLPMFPMYLNRFQIRPEERALSARFGSAYVDYAQSVRRWL